MCLMTTIFFCYIEFNHLQSLHNKVNHACCTLYGSVKKMHLLMKKKKNLGQISVGVELALESKQISSSPLLEPKLTQEKPVSDRKQNRQSNT